MGDRSPGALCSGGTEQTTCRSLVAGKTVNVATSRARGLNYVLRRTCHVCTDRHTSAHGSASGPKK